MQAQGFKIRTRARAVNAVRDSTPGACPVIDLGVHREAALLKDQISEDLLRAYAKALEFAELAPSDLSAELKTATLEVWNLAFLGHRGSR